MPFIIRPKGRRGGVPCILTMELKITVDVGICRLGRRSEAAANNQPTFMAGGAARERACDEECRAPLPNADFGSGGREPSTLPEL